jgi:hypothetical protein
MTITSRPWSAVPSVFTRTSAPSRRRRGIRHREVFSAQFDGGQGRASSASLRGFDALEARVMLTAAPESDFAFSNGVITGYRGAGGDVEIPATIGGEAVVSIGDAAFYGAPLASVTIPSSVTSIGSYAFQSDTGLTSVMIGSGVRSIGTYAFQGDAALASVTFTGKAPSVGTKAFAGLASGAHAFRSATLKGYGRNGSNFYGLTVATPVG